MVVFGTCAVVFAYLVFDIIELGTLGSQLFLSVFGLVSLFTLALFRHVVYASGAGLYFTQLIGTDPNSLVFWGLFASSLLLSANVAFDVRVLGRTRIS